MSRIALLFLAAVTASPGSAGIDADQAMARYRALTGQTVGVVSAQRRCDADAAAEGEIVVCARDTEQYRLPLRVASERAAAGDRILHRDEVPKSSGVIDAAPCPPSTFYCVKAGETYHRIFSWITGSDPD